MRLVEQIFKMVAPSNCLGCREEGSLLCAWCVEAHLPERLPRCYSCNTLTKSHSVCPKCQRKSTFTRLWIRTDHTDTARQLVHRMKFSYSGEAADIIAAELVNTIPALPPETIIVHVPTVSLHVRQRGYDHARRIASHMASLTPYRHSSVLVRLGQHRQVGSSRGERLHGVKGTFRVRHEYLIKDQHVLLVDDVLTTGATLNEAARVLKEAGARRVDAVVFARAK